MSTLDLLFWLLVALLGGIVWAIEAGLAARHRSALLSSAVATLGTMVYVMFWVEDITRMQPLKAQKFEKKEEQGARGQVDFGGRKKGKAKVDDKAGKEEEEPAGEEAKQEDDASKEAVYNREPFKDCPYCPSMVIVPTGVSQVGSPADERGRTPEEQLAGPAPVAKPFAIGRLEILRGEYAAFVAETGHTSAAACDTGSKRRGKWSWERPGFEQDERHPVTCVSAHDVQLYLAWLNGKTKQSYRLPTEVEWEHAARAGTKTAYWSGTTLRNGVANVGRVRDGTAVGGLMAANAWGISDQMGNLWEMTGQCTGEGSTVVDHTRDLAECRRVLKGGSWMSPYTAARPASRRFLMDGIATNDIGFRIARDVDERDKDKVLTPEQRKALEKADQDLAEIKYREEEAAEEAARKRREAAEAEDKADREKAAKAKK